MSGPTALTPEPARRVTVGRWSAELLPRRPYEARYTADRPVLGFAFESQEGVHAYASDRIRPFRARPNGLAYVPKGCEVFSCSASGGEYLVLTGFDLEEEGGFAFSDRIDSLAVAAAHELRRLFLASPFAEPLRYEAQMIALVDRLCLQMGCRAPSSDTPQWMTARRLRRIDEIIEGNLDGELTVQALAEGLGLSAGFFSRAFKQATGWSPHAYIVDRRVARARSLITAGAVDLSAVALAVGFSSHAHLSATFHRQLGISPSALRRSFNLRA
ncbi:AraC family transcriptional regulator [Sinorhizobium alkalisoli]|uniref:HTH araC/xylS-type domain-containing protein n=1 Tax=Sinorhizobium alkalisoli TaxID=1752398 RepID=A0A1E3VFD6_9HYPH|nr:AraC family transcriptional regulator [Sinorhizobium alkalisoli]MCA1492231.1 helix-turn-helix transcriptional regulator [Ensifer sp. NBAIM29]ODR92310.1 hypothetical protein A8M32_05670 [Sinorhizobium alkalisoli]